MLSVLCCAEVSNPKIGLVLGGGGGGAKGLAHIGYVFKVIGKCE